MGMAVAEELNHAQFGPAQLEGMDLDRYSVQRAIGMQLPKGTPGHIASAGLELEVHQELEKNRLRYGKDRGGILIPSNINAPDPRAARRGAEILGRAYPLDSVTSTEGTEFKFTRPLPLVEMLRQKLIAARLGAIFLPGLPGPVALPRETAGSTAAWQPAEGSANSDSMPAFDQVALTPKTLISTTGATVTLVTVASEEFEALLRLHILRQHRVAIDTAVFVGTGASGQPAGIFVAAGVQSYDVGPGANANAAPDNLDVTTMAGLIGDANADDGPVAFATTPLVAATLKRTVASPASDVVWSGDFLDGRCGGFRAAASNVLSKTLNNGVPGGGVEHGFVCGNFAELLIGEFGAFELVVDPFSQKKSAVIEFTSFQMVDIAFRHAASFVKGVNAIP